MRSRATAMVLLLLVPLSACDNGSSCPECFEPPDCTTGRCVPRCGTATLMARTTFDDYEAATISFRHATVEEDGQVNNNWDLLFGNDQDPDRDLFAVNMVTDDRSFIVDLGELASICDAPSTVDLRSQPTGAFGDHDDIPVTLDHMYLIRNSDSQGEQYALVQVLGHATNRAVTLRWYRSPTSDRFTPPAACGQL